jgi:hypothetical protein
LKTSVAALITLSIVLTGCAAPGEMRLIRTEEYYNRIKSRAAVDPSKSGPQLMASVRAGGRANMAIEPDAKGCETFAEPLPDVLISVPQNGMNIKFTSLGTPLATIVLVTPDRQLSCSPKVSGFQIPELTARNLRAGVYQLRIGMPRSLIEGYLGYGAAVHGDGKFTGNVQVFAEVLK